MSVEERMFANPVKFLAVRATKRCGKDMNLARSCGSWWGAENHGTEGIQGKHFGAAYARHTVQYKGDPS